MNSSPPDPSSGHDSNEDFGEIVRAPRVHRIWAWIFPALAAAAGLWLLWSNWKERGPEIEIHFAEAPGIQAGKTALLYRGIAAGRVTAVRLDPTLGGVVVQVRLKTFAARLASEHTEFWIDQPVISIRQTTGLDAIIQGNSIQARFGGGTPATRFKGLANPPLDPLEQAGLVLRLRANEVPFLGRGTPVYHRGVAVGYVRSKEINAAGNPILVVGIDEKYRATVSTASRFWVLPAASLKLSPRGASLSVPGLDAVIEGGIAFDAFSADGQPAAANAEFFLAPTEQVARMDGPKITLAFEDAHGLVPGETLITCFGYPIGLVEAVRLDAPAGLVAATARLDSRHAALATTGARLTLVQPRISPEGISGLETIVFGPYVALTPGPGEPANHFAVRTLSRDEWDRAEAEREGVSLVLTAATLLPLEVGAPVLYRGLAAGRVTDRFLAPSGQPALRVAVTREFRDQVTARSRFWPIPAAHVSAGPGVLEFEIPSALTLLRGGIAFENFPASGATGPRVSDGTTFPLCADEAAARATSPPIRIRVENAQGVLAGKTQLRRNGIPVGLVERTRHVGDHVEITARLDPGQDDLRRRGAEFAVVQPRISVSGFTGIETIVSGVYFDCHPGTGAFAEAFDATSTGDPELIATEDNGFLIKLSVARTTIRPGAPVTYRGTVVGKIVEKSLSPDARLVILTASIDPAHRDLVRDNSVFWDDGRVQAQIGFLKVRIDGNTIVAPDGKVAFFTPGRPGSPARAGASFPLGENPPRGQ